MPVFKVPVQRPNHLHQRLSRYIKINKDKAAPGAHLKLRELQHLVGEVLVIPRRGTLFEIAVQLPAKPMKRTTEFRFVARLSREFTPTVQA